MGQIRTNVNLPGGGGDVVVVSCPDENARMLSVGTLGSPSEVLVVPHGPLSIMNESSLLDITINLDRCHEIRVGIYQFQITN